MSASPALPVTPSGLPSTTAGQPKGSTAAASVPASRLSISYIPAATGLNSYELELLGQPPFNSDPTSYSTEIPPITGFGKDKRVRWHESDVIRHPRGMFVDPETNKIVQVTDYFPYNQANPYLTVKFESMHVQRKEAAGYFVLSGLCAVYAALRLGPKYDKHKKTPDRIYEGALAAAGSVVLLSWGFKNSLYNRFVYPKLEKEGNNYADAHNNLRVYRNAAGNELARIRLEAEQKQREILAADRKDKQPLVDEIKKNIYILKCLNNMPVDYWSRIPGVPCDRGLTISDPLRDRAVSLIRKLEALVENSKRLDFKKVSLAAEMNTLLPLVPPLRTQCLDFSREYDKRNALFDQFQSDIDWLRSADHDRYITLASRLLDKLAEAVKKNDITFTAFDKELDKLRIEMKLLNRIRDDAQKQIDSTLALYGKDPCNCAEPARERLEEAMNNGIKKGNMSGLKTEIKNVVSDVRKLDAQKSRNDQALKHAKQMLAQKKAKMHTFLGLFSTADRVARELKELEDKADCADITKEAADCEGSIRGSVMLQAYYDLVDRLMGPNDDQPWYMLVGPLTGHIEIRHDYVDANGDEKYYHLVYNVRYNPATETWIANPPVKHKHSALYRHTIGEVIKLFQ